MEIYTEFTATMGQFIKNLNFNDCSNPSQIDPDCEHLKRLEPVISSLSDATCTIEIHWFNPYQIPIFPAEVHSKSSFPLDKSHGSS